MDFNGILMGFHEDLMICIYERAHIYILYMILNDIII